MFFSTIIMLIHLLLAWSELFNAIKDYNFQVFNTTTERERNANEIEIRVKEIENTLCVFCIGLLNSISLSPKLSLVFPFNYRAQESRANNLLQGLGTGQIDRQWQRFCPPGLTI